MSSVVSNYVIDDIKKPKGIRKRDVRGKVLKDNTFFLRTPFYIKYSCQEVFKLRKFSYFCSLEQSEQEGLEPSSWQVRFQIVRSSGVAGPLWSQSYLLCRSNS